MSYEKIEFQPYDTLTAEQLNHIQDGILNSLNMELLWENASPTSEFAKQTINLDLSGYSHIRLVWKEYMEDGHIGGMLDVQVGKSWVIHVPRHYNFLRGGSSNETSVFIADCSYFNTYGNAANFSTNNTCVIPFRIYGIKGVSE